MGPEHAACERPELTPQLINLPDTEKTTLEPARIFFNFFKKCTCIGLTLFIKCLWRNKQRLLLVPTPLGNRLCELFLTVDVTSSGYEKDYGNASIVNRFFDMLSFG